MNISNHCCLTCKNKLINIKNVYLNGSNKYVICCNYIFYFTLDGFFLADILAFDKAEFTRFQSRIEIYNASNHKYYNVENQLDNNVYLNFIQNYLLMV